MTRVRPARSAVASGMGDHLLDHIDPINRVDITIRNFTTDNLFFHSAHHESGEFTTEPAPFIGHSKPSIMFTFISSQEKSPSFFTGTEGRLTYSIGEQQDTFFTVFWNNPAAGSNSASTMLEGFHPGRYAIPPLSVPESGSHLDLLVDLERVGDLLDLPPIEIPPPLAPQPPLLNYGASDVNGWVQHLQELLTAAGHGPLAPDGQFGPATYHAVQAFQSARDLTVDGIVGPQTWTALLT
jgi:putative peptidoglycan binding protein